MLPLARHPVSSAAARPITARSARGDVRSAHGFVPSASAIGRCAADTIVGRGARGHGLGKRQEVNQRTCAPAGARSRRVPGAFARRCRRHVWRGQRVLAPLCAGGAGSKKNMKLSKKIIIIEESGPSCSSGWHDGTQSWVRECAAEDAREPQQQGG